MTSPDYDLLIVGGGFYGCVIALDARARGVARVGIIERDTDLLQRASYANQARVHHGYHYPRSYVTAVRSRVNLPRFIDTYRDCIDDSFDSYYAIARRHSNVTAEQFALFCDRVGAPAEPAPADILELFNPEMVDGVFRVIEPAFDAARLRERLRRDLAAADVSVRVGTEAVRISTTASGLRLQLRGPDGTSESLTAPSVYNCTYSNVNGLLRASGHPPVPLKHELTEIALVDVPDPLRGIGITTMCGPFFSTMPFPARGVHSFSHVRYTPHFEWHDRPGDEAVDAQRAADTLPRETNFPSMLRHAAMFVPLLTECRYLESLWEVKTVLPQNEIDDGRPILCKEHPALPGFWSIMGSKIDNVYDVLAYLRDGSLVGTDG